MFQTLWDEIALRLPTAEVEEVSAVTCKHLLAYLTLERFQYTGQATAWLANHRRQPVFATGAERAARYAPAPATADAATESATRACSDYTAFYSKHNSLMLLQTVMLIW